jgi:hypothetical protein
MSTHCLWLDVICCPDMPKSVQRRTSRSGKVGLAVKDMSGKRKKAPKPSYTMYELHQNL